MINIRKSTKKNIQRIVKNYNQNITRMSKNPKYYGVVLPEKMSASQIIEDARNYNDIRREIRRMESIKRDGMKDIVEGPNDIKFLRYDQKRMITNIREINKFRNKQRKKIQESFDPARGNYNDEALKELVPKRYNLQSMDMYQFVAYREKLEYLASPKYTDSLADRYKENYLVAVLKNVDITTPDGAFYYQFISHIPADVLYDNYYYNQETVLGFQYTLENQREVMVEVLEYWNEILQKQKDYRPDTNNYEYLIQRVREGKR